MAEITETQYQMLHDRYREASQWADMCERQLEDLKSVAKSLRETNEDLRRIIVEKDERIRELMGRKS